MSCRRFALPLVIAALAASPMAPAAPVVPASDDVVLERLPLAANDPTARRLGSLRARLAQAPGDLSRANQQYETALEVFPNYGAEDAGLGRVAAARGDLDEAIVRAQAERKANARPLRQAGRPNELGRSREDRVVLYGAIQSWMGKGKRIWARLYATVLVLACLGFLWFVLAGNLLRFTTSY